MLADAIGITHGPVSIRWSKTAAPSVTESEVGSGLQARKVRDGSSVCIIGIGKMLSVATEVAGLLEADGISATVWDPRVVRPLDPVMIADASRHDLVVTIEDGLREGGIGMSIRDDVEAHGTGTKVEVLGVPTTYIPHGKPDEILASLGLNAAGVANTIRRAR